MSCSFNIIAACTRRSRGIGLKGKLPWKIPKDLAHFQKITTETRNPKLQNAVIMGRKTWESLPQKFRPLPNRYNLVMSKTHTSGINYNWDSIKVRNFEHALDWCYNAKGVESVFVIGGSQIYNNTIQDKRCQKIYLTEVDREYECDTFFPQIPDNFKLKLISDLGDPPEEPQLQFKIFENIIDPFSQETQYLDLLKEIIEKGVDKADRTGVGIRYLFGRQLEFDLRDGTFPLLTTKRTFLRGVIEELLFFLRGEHDNRKLQEKGVHIWDGNTTREYFDKSGLGHLEEHSLGLAYPHQVRFCGAPYLGRDADYHAYVRDNPDTVTDQLATIIDQLRPENEPEKNRRIILNMWNVPYLKDMALPPCHCLYIFDVDPRGGLSCNLTIRSNDMFLGNPFNIASAAALVYILANISGLEPTNLKINIANAHIYQNHFEQVKRQIARTPYKFPKLRIGKKLTSIADIEALEYEDFILDNYNYHPGIKAPMAV